MNYAIELVEEAKDDMEFWLRNDKRTFKRIISLFENMQQTPYTGIGKPEPLCWELSDCYSRRIDRKNRIVYRVDDDKRVIYVRQLRHHY